MPQTGPDLVSAGYPISNPLSALLGGLQNTVSPNLAARSNASWLGVTGLTDVSSPAASGVALSVAVPVTPGDVITQVRYLVGASAASSPTHAWAAIYAGNASASPALLGQTADTGSVALASGAQGSFGFATPVTITSVNAPYGYVYVTIAAATASGSMPSMISATLASSAGGYYKWFSTQPIFLAATHESALGSAAPATMGATSMATKAPIVFLT